MPSWPYHRQLCYGGDGVSSRDQLFMRATGQPQQAWRDATMMKALHKLTSTGRAVFNPRLWNSEHPNRDVVVMTSRFDNEGYRVCAADECGGLMVLDARKAHCQRCTPPLLRNPRAHKAVIFEVLWTHDSRSLVTAGADQLCKIWDLNSKGHHEVLRGHNGSVKAIAQSSQDHDIFVTGSRDGRAIMWDLRVGGRDKAVMQQNVPVVRHYAFLSIPHAHHPLVQSFCDNRSRKRRRYSGPIKEQIKAVTGVALLRGKEQIVTSGSDGMLQFWDSRMLRAQHNRAGKPFLTVDYSEVDDDVLTSLGQGATTGAGDSSHGQVIRRQKAISNLSLSPDGTRLLVGITNGVLYTHDVSSPPYHRLPTRYTGHFNRSFYPRARFSPCGNYILSGSTNTSAYIWETRGDGWPILKLDGHRCEVNDISMSAADPTYVATASDDNCVRLWSVRSQGEAKTQTAACECGAQGGALLYRDGKASWVPRWKVKEEEEEENDDDDDFVSMMRRMGECNTTSAAGAGVAMGGGGAAAMHDFRSGPAEGVGGGGGGAATSGSSSSTSRQAQGARSSSLRQSTLKDLWGKASSTRSSTKSSSSNDDDEEEEEEEEEEDGSQSP